MRYEVSTEFGEGSFKGMSEVRDVSACPFVHKEIVSFRLFVRAVEAKLYERVSEKDPLNAEENPLEWRPPLPPSPLSPLTVWVAACYIG